MFYKKVAHKILSKFTCNLIKKETATQAYVCEFSEHIWQNTCKWLVLDFAQFYMSHSIIYFIKRNSKKWNYYFLNVFNRTSISENYRQTCNFSLYFLLKSSTWNHLLGHGNRHKMNKWMKIFDSLQVRYKLATSKKKYIFWVNLQKVMILMI